MPINRAPWNALVDDSGQNLDGSIWNKAAIKTVVLDPVDNAFLWTPLAFNAAQFSGLAPTAAQVRANRYVLIGKTLWWNLDLDFAPLVGAPGAIYVTFPLGAAAANLIVLPIHMTVGAGGYEVGRASTVGANGTALQITRTNYAAFPAGNAALNVLFTMEIL